MDLESAETAMRVSMHRAASAALTQLLQFAPPDSQRSLPCSCGNIARYKEQRSKPILTIVGLVTVIRPYYLCSRCHVGQFPIDSELDIVEAWKRGWSQAHKKVVIGDGAEWIWNIADQHFPGAVHIVDIFHARQHLWDIARALHPLDQIAQQRWILRHQLKLDAGQIEKLTAYLDSRLAAATPAEQEILRVETDYFDKNKDRMRYPEFRAHGLFSGSGVIEAGCKTLIGARLKQSGMFWSVEGANAIIALRCCQINNRFEDLAFTLMSRTHTEPGLHSLLLSWVILCSVAQPHGERT